MSGWGHAGSFLHVLHLHLLVVDPEVRGPKVLLAALPLAGAVARSLPAQRARQVRTSVGRKHEGVKGQHCLSWVDAIKSHVARQPAKYWQNINTLHPPTVKALELLMYATIYTDKLEQHEDRLIMLVYAERLI